MALALEGTPVHLTGSGFTGVFPAFTTSNPALIVATMNKGGVNITSVTGGGLTWARRAASGSNDSIEHWTATSPSALSGVIFTINSPDNSAYIWADLFAISGGDTSTIFDGNASIPANGTSQLSVSTNNTNDFIFAAYGTYPTLNPTSGSGWTLISGADYTLVEYKIVSSTQTNLAITLGGGTTANLAVADAVMQATVSSNILFAQSIF